MLTNRSKNKCESFLTLFLGLLYSPNERKRTVRFKLHFSLLLTLRSRKHTYTVGILQKKEGVVTDAMKTFTSIVLQERSHSPSPIPLQLLRRG